MLLEDSLQKRSFATLWGRISKGEMLQMTKLDQWIVVYSDPLFLLTFKEIKLRLLNKNLFHIFLQ